MRCWPSETQSFKRNAWAKCEDVSRREGRTVIFVSHNMAAVNSLCSKGILLDKGEVREIGDTISVVSKYLIHMEAAREGQWTLPNGAGQRERKSIYLTSVSVLNHEGKVSSKLEVTRPFYVCLSCAISGKVSGVELMLRIETYDGIAVFSSLHQLRDAYCVLGRDQVKTYNVKIPEMLLMPGSYFVSVGAHTPMVEIHDLKEQVLGLEVLDTGTAFAIHGNYRKIGIVMADLSWNENLDVQFLDRQQLSDVISCFNRWYRTEGGT